MQIEEINHFIEKQGLESDCQTMLMFNIIWKGKFYFCLPKTKPLFCKEVKKKEGKKKKNGFTVTKEWLYSPIPATSSSLSLTHAHSNW